MPPHALSQRGSKRSRADEVAEDALLALKRRRYSPIEPKRPAPVLRDPRLSKLRALLQRGELLSKQPEQANVIDADSTARVVLLLTPELRRRHDSWRRDGAVEGALKLSPVGFCVSERYKCLPDPRGQVQGGIGFILRAVDRTTGGVVALKLFHRTSTEHRLMQCYHELKAGLLLHAPLHATNPRDFSQQQSQQQQQQDGYMSDLCHVLRLRDVLVDAPLLRLDEDNSDTGFRACAMVYDYAPHGDMHAHVSAYGSLPVEDAVALFRQLLLGLRGLHRRDIAHRDVKPENLVLGYEGEAEPAVHESGFACFGAGGEGACVCCPCTVLGTAPLLRLCDMGFMKKVNCALSELDNDPTTCYQGPERWMSSTHRHATNARASWGLPLSSRKPESPSLLRCGDMFGAGVTLLFMLGHDAILRRSQDPVCQGDDAVSAMSLFEAGKRGHGFALLTDGPKGTPQTKLWRYWERFGLVLPREVQVLMEGLLHPRPEGRWTADEAIAFVDSAANADCFAPHQLSVESCSNGGGFAECHLPISTVAAEVTPAVSPALSPAVTPRAGAEALARAHSAFALSAEAYAPLPLPLPAPAAPAAGAAAAGEASSALLTTALADLLRGGGGVSRHAVLSTPLPPQPAIVSGSPSAAGLCTGAAASFAPISPASSAAAAAGLAIVPLSPAQAPTAATGAKDTPRISSFEGFFRDEYSGLTMLSQTSWSVL